MQAKWNLIMFAALGFSSVAGATDLTLHLNGTQPLRAGRCGTNATRRARPWVYPREHLRRIHQRGRKQPGGCPIHETSMIFANVVSGSGARYAAGPYIWWMHRDRLISTRIRSRQNAVRVSSGRTPSDVKSLSNLADRQNIALQIIEAVRQTQRRGGAPCLFIRWCAIWMTPISVH